MKLTHILIIAFAILLATAVYVFFPPSKGPEKAAPQTAQQSEKPGFSIQDYLNKVNKSLSADTASLVEKWEKAADFEQLTALYHAKGESIAEAFYTEKQAKKTGNKELFERSGDLFEATSGLTENQELSVFLVENAIGSFQSAMEIDSADVFLKMKLASAYIQQGSNPMQGISMLLDIVKKDPKNADAQLMLAKFAMMSGQFEKAIERLEKVISLRPQSNDALFLLAMAHQNNGNKEKAIELLEKCSRNEKDPELKKEIEGYIKQLRQS